MGVVDYLVVNGVLLSETRGGVESDYIADPLGSTAALMSTAGAITDTFTYWPYGQLRSHVGTSVTPYQYGGTLGYYTDGPSGRVSASMRVYNPTVTRWLTVDLLWPIQRPYVYCFGRPISMVDRLGMAPNGPHSHGPVPPLPIRCTKQWSNYLDGLLARCNDLDDDNSVCLDSYYQLVELFNSTCPGGSGSVPTENGCQNMVKHMCNRHSEHGNPTWQWLSSCYDCCGSLYDKVQRTPMGKQLMEQCMKMCAKGEFVPPPTNFRPPAGTIIPPLLD